MTPMPESTFEKIMRKSGVKPTSCKCQKCKQQCQTAPCIGTPEDMKRLIDAGYVYQLAVTGWGFGMLIGVHPEPVAMIAPDFDQERGCCTFFQDGLCTLHAKGLKPTEGRLSHHSQGGEGFKPQKSIGWQIAKEWLDAGWTDQKVEDVLVGAALVQAMKDSARLFAEEAAALQQQAPGEENY